MGSAMFDTCSTRLHENIRWENEDNSVIITCDGLLDVCGHILPVISMLGTGFFIVQSDVSGNIERLRVRMEEQPERYRHNVFQILLDEKEQGVCLDSSSCTNGLLWLTRAMTFVVTLLENLLEDHLQGEEEEDASFSEIITMTYSKTLQQYHGWVTSGTFTLLLKLVPYKDTFWTSIGVNRDIPLELQSMQTFCESFRRVLDDIYDFLDTNDLNNPAKV